jgi:hypothetical protein
MSAIQPITFRTTEGVQHVDTDQGCSACKGQCPCPQACERREEALAAQKLQRRLPQWIAAVCGRFA